MGVNSKEKMQTAYRRNLYDAPSVAWEGRCSICGRFANNHHHVIQKGIGGTKNAKRIPTVLLCGMGNASGCHGMVHAKKLHLNYDRESGDWLFCYTEPMDDEMAWELYKDDFRVLPAWEQMKLWAEAPIFGRRA